MSNIGNSSGKRGSLFRSKKYDYLNDYKRGMNGEYVYYGTYHIFQGTDKERLQLTIKMLILDVIIVALYILGGIIDAGKLWHTSYVVIPFALEAIAIFILCWRTISLMFEKSRIKDYIYQKTVPWIPVISTILAVIEGISVITAVIYIIITKERVGSCILYIVVKAVMGGLVFFFSKHFTATYNWTSETPEEVTDDIIEG